MFFGGNVFGTILTFGRDPKAERMRKGQFDLVGFIYLKLLYMRL